MLHDYRRDLAEIEERRRRSPDPIEIAYLNAEEAKIILWRVPTAEEMEGLMVLPEMLDAWMWWRSRYPLNPEQHEFLRTALEFIHFGSGVGRVVRQGNTWTIVPERPKGRRG